MATPNKITCGEEEFIAMYQDPEIGPTKIAETYGVNIRSVHKYRRGIETRRGINIVSTKTADGGPSANPKLAEIQALQEVGFEAKEAIESEIKNGVILVGSDAHYWPGMRSTAHAGFVHFIKEMKPKMVVMNGDVLDGATISRFPPPGWEYQPELIDELEACYMQLQEIKAAAPRGCRRIWTYGNHDQRFELKLATLTREYGGIKGFHLHDHFEDWERCWLISINAHTPDWTIIKHRFKGGVHATYNNIIHSGVHMVTGHLHSAKAVPKTNYRGTLWGVDCGTLAEPKGRQFTNYTEGNPSDWRSAFVVLTFKNGRLLQPELALVWEKGKIQFRGEIINVR